MTKATLSRRLTPILFKYGFIKQSGYIGYFRKDKVSFEMSFSRYESTVRISISSNNPSIIKTYSAIPYEIVLQDVTKYINEFYREYYSKTDKFVAICAVKLKTK